MKQLYLFNTLKLSLLMLFTVVTFFGTAKVEAGTVPTIWYYQNNLGIDYHTCQAMVSLNQNCVYDPISGGSVCTAITPDPGYIWVDRSFTTINGQNGETVTTQWQQCLISSQYTVYQTMATYAAATNKDVYTPGEPVMVSVVATVGDTGNQIGGFFSGGILNGVFCFLLGCSAPKGVTADAIVPSIGSVASCGGSGTCNNSPGQTFTAPATPGTYIVNLVGGYWLAGMNAYSNMSFMVVSPPSVTIKFAFLNRIKNSLQNIFAFAEQKKALDKTFTKMMQ